MNLGSDHRRSLDLSSQTKQTISHQKNVKSVIPTPKIRNSIAGVAELPFTWKEKRLSDVVNEIRTLSQLHTIGSNVEGDMKLLRSLKETGGDQRDNLLIPLSNQSRLTHFPKYGKRKRFSSITGKLTQRTPQLDDSIKISESELGITAQELEEAFPIPPVTVFTTNKKGIHKSSKHKNEEILDPDFIGVLLRLVYSYNFNILGVIEVNM